MRVLVSGGNGYVGRALTRRLYDDHEVHVLDDLRYGGSRFRPNEERRFGLHRVDLRDAAAVTATVARVAADAVVHLAAIHFIPDCERDPGAAVAVNVSGTVHLLQACRPGCRFVFASSGAVYGPDDRPHREHDSLVAPDDVYGLTKLHGEGYVRYFARRRELSATIVRLFNVVGPGETNPHVVPEIVAQLKAGRDTLHLGDVTPRRDFVHVEDAAHGFRAAVLADAPVPGEVDVVNLGSGRPHSVAEVLELLGEIRGAPIPVRTDPARLRPGDRPFMAADVQRLADRFDWTPQRTLADALADLWSEPDLPAALVARYRS